jgi:hypothetical protein
MMRNMKIKKNAQVVVKYLQKGQEPQYLSGTETKGEVFTTTHPVLSMKPEEALVFDSKQQALGVIKGLSVKNRSDFNVEPKA